MEFDQEEALYEFLENTTIPFSLEDITKYVASAGQKRNKRLAIEIAAYLHARRIAFQFDNRRWISRRGCFEPAKFVITPTRLELLNGILIPGHRCIPFANPLNLPHHYKFFWQGKQINATTTEAPPEDLYPYYCIYGEEFAPQYIARDNPNNETAYNADPYEDPPEVSIHTLDMRSLYRECAFVPGDRFQVTTIDWKESWFLLERVAKDDWKRADLEKWAEAAETGFENCFALLGPGSSTEEQIAYAFWYGGPRMRETPACSLEEFLYEKTNRIDTVPYGIETRFWFAGKEIPDNNKIQNNTVPPDRTYIEDLLFEKNIPVSEYVILAYIRDAFFRNEKDIDEVINRLIPPVIHMEESEWNVIADYISERMEDFFDAYSLFLDQATGPIRQRVTELHTAVIELCARLKKGEIETAWLPRHTFIVLSQIQEHSAALLEDLVFDDSPSAGDLTAIENSLDSMVDTYGDIKELINNAMDNFRRSNLTVIHGGKIGGQLWRMIQISITGLDVWRRAIVSQDYTIKELHKLIQAGMNWKDQFRFRFYCETNDGGKEYLHDTMKLSDIDFRGKKELIYEYGSKWNLKIIIMSSYQPAIDEVARFVAGDGSSPPEQVQGPKHFNKLYGSSIPGFSGDRHFVLHEKNFDVLPEPFDMDKANKLLWGRGGITLLFHIFHSEYHVIYYPYYHLIN